MHALISFRLLAKWGPEQIVNTNMWIWNKRISVDASPTAVQFYNDIVCEQGVDCFSNHPHMNP